MLLLRESELILISHCLFCSIVYLLPLQFTRNLHCYHLLYIYRYFKCGYLHVSDQSVARHTSSFSREQERAYLVIQVENLLLGYWTTTSNKVTIACLPGAKITILPFANMHAHATAQCALKLNWLDTITGQYRKYCPAQNKKFTLLGNMAMYIHIKGLNIFL